MTDALDQAEENLKAIGEKVEKIPPFSPMALLRKQERANADRKAAEAIAAGTVRTYKVQHVCIGSDDGSVQNVQVNHVFTVIPGDVVELKLTLRIPTPPSLIPQASSQTLLRKVSPSTPSPQP